MPKGKIDTRRVTFMDNGVVYIHDSHKPEDDSKEEVFPTTAAVRAKEQRVEKERLWADAGDRAAIKESRKRKPQQQEDHHDDCGEDCNPLEEAQDVAMLAMSNLEDDRVEASFMDDITMGAPIDEMHQINDGSFERHYLLGSDAEEVPTYWNQTAKDSQYVPVHELSSYLATPEMRGIVDVMEICGGKGGVSKISIRRRLKTGKNFDLVTGGDLTNSVHAKHLFDYIEIHKPLVIIMAPPCTSMGGWAKINKHQFPETYAAKRRIGEALANLCAKVMEIQLVKGRHFVLENPRGSEIFHLQRLAVLFASGCVKAVNFPQCSVGLVGPTGIPMQKWTTLWASCESLLEAFRLLKCTCKVHQTIEGTQAGTVLSQHAQVWPSEMCKMLVCGICKLKVGNQTKPPNSKQQTAHAYPTTEYGCAGCIAKRISTDPTHTRNATPPNQCRHPDILSMEWKCPGCRNHARRKNQHSLVPGECRFPEERREFGVRRSGGPQRDPARPASGSAARRNRLTPYDDEAEEGIRPLPEELQGKTDDVTQPMPELESPGGSPRDPVHREEEAEVDGNEADSEKSSDSEEDTGGGVLNHLGPSTALDRKLRRARTHKKDIAVQAGDNDKEDWRTFDASRAMTALRSTDPTVRRRTLQRLHVRWYHATTTQMTQTLKAARVPGTAIADIASVVQGCTVCRDWTRPGPKNIASYRLVVSFNEEVQFDLLFYHSLVDNPSKLRSIMHLVDACVRWSTAAETNSKEEEELTTSVSVCWISIFGAMQTLVLDEESGMRGRCAVDWAEANNIGLKYKAPRQKAWIVERHNELLRQGLHTTETQMIKEGIVMPFKVILATVTFAKNALTVINDSTPYQAVLGRQPSILPPLEGGYNGSLVDDQARPETGCRGTTRVREIAACNIIETVARARMERAHKHKTRKAVEILELQPGSVVDLWFDQTTKDVPGWRGPAKVATINTEEGNITVRYQGRSIDRQNSEIREHIPYLVFFSGLHDTLIHHWYVIRDWCEALAAGTSKTLGLIWDQGKAAAGWRSTRVSRTPEGKALLQAAMIIAHTAMSLNSCTTVRCAKGPHQLQPMIGFEASELWLWKSVVHGGNAEEAPMIFEAGPGDLAKPCPTKEIIMELSDVRSSHSRWQEYCVLQFLCIPEQETARILAEVPGSRQGGIGRNPHKPPPSPRRPDGHPPSGPPPPPQAPAAQEPQRFRIDTPGTRSRTPQSAASPNEPIRR